MAKKLYRSTEHKVLGGVCGGIGEYFDVDPVLIRILVVVLCLMWGIGIVVYIIAWITIPLKPKESGEVELEHEVKRKEADGN